MPTNSSEELLHKLRDAPNVAPDMNNRFCQLFILITCICAGALVGRADASNLASRLPNPASRLPNLASRLLNPASSNNLSLVQRLVPRWDEGERWTREDKSASDQYFIRFHEATKSGQLILAGRTQEPGEKTLGIAIFRASDEAAAVSS